LKILNFDIKLDFKNHIEKQLEAEKIVRWCMHICDSYERTRNRQSVLLSLIESLESLNLTLSSFGVGFVVGTIYSIQML